MISKWFPKVDSEEVARDLAKQGAYAAIAFAAMTILGLIFAYSTNYSVSDRSQINTEDVTTMMWGGALVLPVQLFMAFRIYKGKGWLASIVLSLWFLLEIAIKILGGTASPAWFVFYLVIIGSLVNGFRACWYFRNNQPAYPVNEPTSS